MPRRLEQIVVAVVRDLDARLHRRAPRNCASFHCSWIVSTGEARCPRRAACATSASRAKLSRSMRAAPASSSSRCAMRPARRRESRVLRPRLPHERRERRPLAVVLHGKGEPRIRIPRRIDAVRRHVGMRVAERRRLASGDLRAQHVRTERGQHRLDLRQVDVAAPRPCAACAAARRQRDQPVHRGVGVADREVEAADAAARADSRSTLRGRRSSTSPARTCASGRAGRTVLPPPWKDRRCADSPRAALRSPAPRDPLRQATCSRSRRRSRAASRFRSSTARGSFALSVMPSLPWLIWWNIDDISFVGPSTFCPLRIGRPGEPRVVGTVRRARP